MHNFLLFFLNVITLFGVVMSMEIKELNHLNMEYFVSELGKIFENSPWVAQEAYAKRPFANVDELFNTMQRVIMNAGREKQLSLIRAHPELAGTEMFGDNLTEYSTSEQSNAGLNALTAGQLADLNMMNSAYKKRFSFPFIVALRDQQQHKDSIIGIMSTFRRRMNNTEEQEIGEALVQIGRIARHRLNALMEKE